MYSATSMLSKARSNPVYGKINENGRLYYRNVYLKSEYWKNLRKEKLEINPICEICKTNLSLDVHHKEYKGLYDVSIVDLQTLCRVCHNKEHDKKNLKKEKKDKRLRNRNRKFSKESLDYNDFWYIFNCDFPNYYLIKWILKYLVYALKNKQEKPPYLSKFNQKHQKKFDEKYKEIPKELNTYISIHY